MLRRPAFTIIEVLIAIALMGIILPALYESVALLRNSNMHLFKHLEKANKRNKAIETLYLDILSSDGNISIQKDDFSRLCIENSRNSLYALSVAKVCWLVLKNDNTLVRVEGYDYTLPLRIEDKVEVNKVMKDLELFDVYYSNNNVLVLLKQAKKEAITFMVQGVTEPKKKKKKPKNKKINKKPKPKKDTNGTQPNPTSPNIPPVPSTPAPGT